MKHLTRLIDDLLDVSRITRGKIELRRDVLDATPILDSAAATVRPLVEERKHTLEVAIDRGNLWVERRPDPARAGGGEPPEQRGQVQRERGAHPALGPERGRTRSSSPSRTRASASRPRSCPQMFELFAQGDRSLARSEGGLGIGLTVVKKLVEMHGGSVAAHERGARARGASSRSGSPRREAGRRRRPTAAGRRRRAEQEGPDPRRRRQRGHGPRDGEAPEAHRPRGGDGPRRARGHRGRQGAPARVHPARHRPARAWTATRSPRRLRQEACCKDAVDRRRLGLRPGRGPPPLEGGGLRPPPRQAARPRRLAHAALGRC